MHGDFGTSGFSDALVILGAAGIVIPAFARLRITPVIGFILVGMIVGPSGLGGLTDEIPLAQLSHHLAIPHAIDPFAELGIILLLFAIGLELSFRRLVGDAKGGVRGRRRGAAWRRGPDWRRALSPLGKPAQSAIALGFALAMSSTALVLPIAGTTSPVGRAALAMLLFEDLALVPLLFLFGTAAAGAATRSARRPLEGRAGDCRIAASSAAWFCRCCSPRRRGPRAPSCSSPSACWS